MNSHVAADQGFRSKDRSWSTFRRLVFIGAALAWPQPSLHGQECVQWRERTTSGEPGRRGYHAMAEDTWHQTVLLFGGAVEGRLSDETWEWDGAAWHQRFPAHKPSARVNHAMAYDSARGEVVLFGGNPGGDETWIWDGNDWQQRFPAVSPPAREHHAMAYDAARGVVVLVGGLVSGVVSGDTWLWNGGTWIPTAVGEPGARMGHAMAYDGARGEVVLFGGVGPGGQYSDTWLWEPDHGWQNAWTSGPPVRGEHAMAYLPQRNKVFMYGGVCGGSCCPDTTWEWTGSTRQWREVPIPVPEVRLWHAMAYHPSGALVLQGGVTEVPFDYTDDTWELVADPHIFRQPQNTYQPLGNTGGFHVVAETWSGPPSYQWYKDGLLLSDDGRITGATSDTLLIRSIEEADGGEYRVTVSDTCGSTQSRPATLTIIDHLRITQVDPRVHDVACGSVLRIMGSGFRSDLGLYFTLTSQPVEDPGVELIDTVIVSENLAQGVMPPLPEGVYYLVASFPPPNDQRAEFESAAEVRALPLPPPRNIESTRLKDYVVLNWSNPVPYDVVEVYRNDELLATLPGDSHTFLDLDIDGLGPFIDYRLQASASTGLGQTAALPFIPSLRPALPARVSAVSLEASLPCTRVTGLAATIEPSALRLPIYGDHANEIQHFFRLEDPAPTGVEFRFQVTRLTTLSGPLEVCIRSAAAPQAPPVWTGQAPDSSIYEGAVWRYARCSDALPAGDYLVGFYADVGQPGLSVFELSANQIFWDLGPPHRCPPYPYVDVAANPCGIRPQIEKVEPVEVVYNCLLPGFTGVPPLSCVVRSVFEATVNDDGRVVDFHWNVRGQDYDSSALSGFEVGDASCHYQSETNSTVFIPPLEDFSGTYPVRLTVTDNDGLTNTYSFDMVSNRPTVRQPEAGQPPMITDVFPDPEQDHRNYIPGLADPKVIEEFQFFVTAAIGEFVSSAHPLDLNPTEDGVAARIEYWRGETRPDNPDVLEPEQGSVRPTAQDCPSIPQPTPCNSDADCPVKSVGTLCDHGFCRCLDRWAQQRFWIAKFDFSRIPHDADHAALVMTATDSAGKENRISRLVFLAPDSCADPQVSGSFAVKYEEQRNAYTVYSKQDPGGDSPLFDEQITDAPDELQEMKGSNAIDNDFTVVRTLFQQRWTSKVNARSTAGMFGQDQSTQASSVAADDDSSDPWCFDYSRLDVIFKNTWNIVLFRNFYLFTAPILGIFTFEVVASAWIDIMLEVCNSLNISVCLGEPYFTFANCLFAHGNIQVEGELKGALTIAHFIEIAAAILHLWADVDGRIGVLISNELPDIIDYGWDLDLAVLIEGRLELLGWDAAEFGPCCLGRLHPESNGMIMPEGDAPGCCRYSCDEHQECIPCDSDGDCQAIPDHDDWHCAYGECRPPGARTYPDCPISSTASESAATMEIATISPKFPTLHIDETLGTSLKVYAEIVDGETHQSRLYYQKKPAGSDVWSEPAPVYPSTDLNLVDTQPSVAFVGAGKAMLVWQRNTMPVMEIQELVDPGHLERRAGNLNRYWSATDIFAATWDSATDAWSAPVAVTVADNRADAFPRLDAVAGETAAWVVFMKQDGSVLALRNPDDPLQGAVPTERTTIWAAKLEIDAQGVLSVVEPLQISATDNLFDFGQTIALAPASAEGYIIWVQQAADDNRRLLSRRLAAGAWGAIQPVFAATSLTGFDEPDLELADGQNGLLAFTAGALARASDLNMSFGVLYQSALIDGVFQAPAAVPAPGTSVRNCFLHLGRMSEVMTDQFNVVRLENNSFGIGFRSFQTLSGYDLDGEAAVAIVDIPMRGAALEEGSTRVSNIVIRNLTDDAGHDLELTFATGPSPSGERLQIASQTLTGTTAVMMSREITVAPDLTVARIDLSERFPIPGRRVNLNIVLRNDGLRRTAPGRGSTTLHVGTVVDGAFHELEAIPVAFAAAPDGTQTVEVPVVAPLEFSHIRAIVDPITDEVETANNVRDVPLGVPPPSNLTCSVENVGGSQRVVLTWNSGAGYDTVQILHDGDLIASLPGGATRYVNERPAPGEHTWTLRGVISRTKSARAAAGCVALVHRLGDMNCDLLVNGQDIEPFRLAMTDPAAYASAHPNCDIRNADMNGDGALNQADVTLFWRVLGFTDCNHNWMHDAQEIAAGLASDCNQNVIPDECDIADGRSSDCQPNNVPDECDILGGHDCCDAPHGPGCSNRAIRDCVCAVDSFCCESEWDRLCVLDVTSEGCGDCEVTNDCNENGVVDGCEINAGTAEDCNENGVIDQCDISAGLSEDTDGNGVPDECEPPQRYVDLTAPPGGNGMSWIRALNDLQAALDAAAASGGRVTQLWVAAGTYKPSKRTDPNDPRSATYELRDGLAVYGGFAGWETSLAQRDVQSNVATLSGDIGVAGYADDNCYHVVVGSNVGATAVLDGFTITGGSAISDLGSPYDRGGGAFIRSGSPTVRNCTFTENRASRGGGVLADRSASPVFINCMFEKNYSSSDGAGCYVDVSSSIGLESCTFAENHSSGEGGAISVYSDCSARARNCAFLGNSAVYKGGAVKCVYSNGTFANCVFSGNRAEEHGGACYFYSTSQRTFALKSCTLSGNSAARTAGAVYMASSASTIALDNTVLWGNTAGEAVNEAAQLTATGNVQANHCCVEGWSGIWGGQGNTPQDPLLVDPDGPDNTFGTEDDDLHLQPGSPCIDTGDNNAVPAGITTDIDGDERILRCRVDIGADESAHIGLDCNGNDMTDACDIAAGISEDCNTTGIPDDCEVAAPPGVGFDDVSAWVSFNPSDHGLTTAEGYYGAVFDGRYVYFAPYRRLNVYHGVVLRYDTRSSFANISSWTAFDTKANVGAKGGYSGAVYDGRYAYFVPRRDGTGSHGQVLRYDTTRDFTTASTWAVYDPGEHGVGSDPDGYAGGVFDGRYVYFVPYDNDSQYHGEVLRYDTTAPFADALSWASYDAGAHGVGADPDGYIGAVFDGRYVYFVPTYNGSAWHGEVLRYDTSAPFDAVSSWRTYDYGVNDGYVGAAFDGRYIYFAPRRNVTDAHGEVLRYDTAGAFTNASSWAAFDPGHHGVGTDPDGYAGVLFDGLFVYFVPFHNGSGYHGEVLRYDTEGNFQNVASWRTYAPTDHHVGTNPIGFYGATTDGRYVYFAPLQVNDTTYHGEVIRYDTTVAWSADCNATSVPDECEMIGGGDFDADGDIDLSDHAALVECLAGCGKQPEPQLPQCVSVCLVAFDFDGDGDIDLADVAGFERVFAPYLCATASGQFDFPATSSDRRRHLPKALVHGCGWQSGTN